MVPEVTHDVAARAELAPVAEAALPEVFGDPVGGMLRARPVVTAGVWIGSGSVRAWSWLGGTVRGRLEGCVQHGVVVAASGGVAGIGQPGQESLKGLAFGCLASRCGASLEVFGQVGQRFAVVAFGGGRDRPDAGCQIRRPLGVAAVVVLPADHGVAKRPL